jgi:membrane protein implicated in regulation of membrane protease activity
VASIITLLIFRKWMRKLLYSRKQKSEIEDEFIGKTGIVLSPISPGIHGKMNFKGTTWDATSEDILQPGERAIIIGNDSILLKVKAIKS